MTTAISPETSQALSASAARRNPPAALQQYTSYRSAPDRFPAYDRLQFVRLPNEMLPASLCHADDDHDQNHGSTTRLTHWPAILYITLHECIRDLPRDTDAILKARLVVDHATHGPRRVARLIGWRGVAPSNGGEMFYFPDASVDLIRLESAEGCADTTEGEVLTFCEHQLDLEEVCRSLMNRLDGVDKGSVVGGGGAEAERDRIEVLQYARKWKRALSMALNILAVDVGQAAMPLTEERDADASSFMENSRVVVQGTAKQHGLSNRVKVIKEETGKRKAFVDISNRPHSKIKSKKNVDQLTTADVSIRIAPYTPWKSVWKTLRSSGWTWRGGSGLMMDYFYVRPGKRIKGGKLGVDYFTSEEDVKAFCKREYGWMRQEEEGEGQRRANVSRAAAVARHDHESSCITDNDSVNDDDDVPPLVSPLRPHSSWRSAWAKMLQSGWTWKKGTGLMMDYYYIKPGKRIKGGKLGVDYFIDRKSLEEYMKRWYGWLGEMDDKDTESMESDDDESHEENKPKIVKTEFEKVLSKSSKSNSSSVPRKDEAKASVNSNTAEEPLEQGSSFVSDFKDLWLQLKEDGWTVIKAGKYNRLHDWYWVRPGCDPGDVRAKLGEHYFLSEDDVMDFVKNAKEATNPIVKIEKESKPRQNCKTSSFDKSDEPSGSNSTFVSDFKDLWSHLKEEGWTVIKAGKYNRLHDWYWVRPGCDPADVTAKLGEHYFLSEDDVMDFVKNAKETCPNVKTQKEAKPQARDKTCSFVKSDGPGSDSSFVSDFRDLWSHLKEEGWTVIKAGKYNRLHDWYWVRPGCDPADVTAKLGEHYFQSEEDVMDFVKNVKESCSNVKRQKEAKPQARDKTCSFDKSDEPCGSDSSFVSDFRDLWSQLKEEGWTVMKAGKYNRLHDWYWVRPGCDPGDVTAMLGEHYFQSAEDVMKFVKAAKETKHKEAQPQASRETSSNNKEEKPSEPSSFMSDWSELWPQLKQEGWTVIKAGKYNCLHDWYWVRPGCDPGRPSSILGQDYFLSKEDVMDVVKQSNGVIGISGAHFEREDEQSLQSLDRPEKEETVFKPQALVRSQYSNPLTPVDCKTKPQDPSIPLPFSPDSSASADCKDTYNWTNLWPTLQKAGWKVIRAGKFNKLHDWYYVRPNRDPADENCKLGSHYFTTPDEVVQFVKMVDEENDSMGGKLGRKSIDVMLAAFEKEAEE
ncbi:hypothetical protein HJC23_013228 [Cyclotella cryptica]|uniref:MBD domain-containing protein n=1 Tax=Cyclotella cryptica TaxID=29204 RepID=A0ABD3P351_9STRA